MHMMIGTGLNIVMPDKLIQGTLVFDLIIFMAGLIGAALIRLINRKLNWNWISYIA